VVFVGGSLVPVGGHNVVEPAAYARPVLIGPHFHNQRSIVETFLDAQAIAVVRDAADLAKQLIELRENRARARELGRRAVEVVERNRGAGERTFQVLCEVLRSVEARG
jgi:3-deoxy-D-manno-octulosonic-acid transferase